MSEMERHPLSAVWGDMPQEQFAELVADVKEHGVLYPVAILDGQVLDGWHRYRAANEAGGDCPAEEFDGGDPAAYVIRNNALRRNLTASQRAAIIIKCREWRDRGRPEAKKKIGNVADLPKSESDMAAEAGTSVRTVHDAKTAERAGLGDKVRSGELSASAAAKQAREQAERDPEIEQPDKWTREAGERLDALAIRFMDLYAKLRESGAANVFPHAPRETQDRLRKAAKRVADWVSGTLEVPRTKAYDELRTKADRLALEVGEKADRIDELEERVAFVESESQPVNAQREKQFNSYREQIRTLKHSVANWQTKYGGAEHENKALRKRLRAHGESIKP